MKPTRKPSKRYRCFSCKGRVVGMFSESGKLSGYACNICKKPTFVEEKK